MARELAAAICDMAAPTFQPVYIMVEALINDLETGDMPVASLVLHVRPRPGSPCPEVAVFKGEVPGSWGRVHLKGPAGIYDIPGTAAGLLAFLEDLVRSTAFWMVQQGRLVQLSQPADYHSLQAAWDEVDLSICSEDAVEVTLELGRDGVVLTFPDYREQHLLLAYKDICSKAAAFRRDPGSSKDTAEDYKRVKNEDVRMLVDGLALMFRQAFRYRGQRDLPAFSVDPE